MDNKEVIKNKLDTINEYYSNWHNGITIKDLKELSFGKCMHCEGPCCKKIPCTYLPSDFGGNLKDQNYIELILESGLVSISKSFLDNPDFLSLRPRNIWEKDKVIGKHIPVLKNRCIFLGAEGCILPREYRPTDGLLYNCKMRDKLLVHEVRKRWEPYQDTLKDIYEEYQHKYIPLPNVSEEKVKEFQKVIMMPHY